METQTGVTPQGGATPPADSDGGVGQVQIKYQSPTLQGVSDKKGEEVSDSVGHIAQNDRHEEQGVGQRPTQTSDSVGHNARVSDTSVGHDTDLPPKTERHALTTYEAGRMFEEADCRVSERTIIRWCNKNKGGSRRLDCAFEPAERKYYINEDSVKKVILEERHKGRQSEQYNPDVSDIPDKMADTNVGQQAVGGGQRLPQTSDSVGHDAQVSDIGVGHAQRETRHDGRVSADAAAENTSRTNSTNATNNDRVTTEEVTELRIKVAKLEEQAKTKDEVMTLLRQEVDRRGEQMAADREMYDNTMQWFRTQVEVKDSQIERLHTEMRGLLEAPKQQPVYDIGETRTRPIQGEEVRGGDSAHT